MLEVKRVLAVGDLHANTSSALAVIDHAVAMDADLILQVGDFGWWPRDQQGRSFLRKVEKRLARHDLDLWWIDGNHEDFQSLAGRGLTDDGRRQVDEHIWHLPRGIRWQWGTSVWVAVGGAVSVDKAYRAEGKTWFTDEELTENEADQIIAAGPADVVVAHDAPLGVPRLRRLLGQDKPAWRRNAEWPTASFCGRTSTSAEFAAWSMAFGRLGSSTAIITFATATRSRQPTAPSMSRVSGWTWTRWLPVACLCVRTARRFQRSSEGFAADHDRFLQRQPCGCLTSANSHWRSPKIAASYRQYTLGPDSQEHQTLTSRRETKPIRAVKVRCERRVQVRHRGGRMPGHWYDRQGRTSALVAITRVR